MKQPLPKILALDFDGVICDGLAEYFCSTQRAYFLIWSQRSPTELELFRDSFYRLRPVIETGWEMLILLRALVLEIPETEILHSWSQVVKTLLAQENLDAHVLMQTLDQVRDRWIQSDLEEWLSLHRFYPGIIEHLKVLQESKILLYIITTKEGRFVQKLLAEQGLIWPSQQLFGKEIKQPKYQTLQQILAENPINPQELWFVEDLLKTLAKIQAQPSLSGIGLFLADWGYNTPESRNSLGYQSEIKLLSLQQFCQDFSCW